MSRWHGPGKTQFPDYPGRTPRQRLRVLKRIEAENREVRNIPWHRRREAREGPADNRER